MTQPLDLSTTFVHLSNGGDTELIKLTPAFWRGTTGGKRYDRLVGTFAFKSSEDLHSTMQEVHPQADELLYVVGGEGTLLLGSQQISLQAGTFSVVPRGMTHTLQRRGSRGLILLSTLTDTPCTSK